MKINLLMFYQDDPKKCTAAKLIKFGLARKITKSQSKTALLHPYAEKTLLNEEKSLFTSITGILVIGIMAFLVWEIPQIDLIVQEIRK